jgi:hypothetical protein
MTKTIAHTHPKTTRPKKKIGIFHRIEPGEQPIDLLCPMIEFRDHAIALVQHGSSWLKLYWSQSQHDVGPCPERVNTLATAFLNQPSTILLKGPLRFSDNTIYGPAYVLHRTALMPYQRIRNGITIAEADERIDRMLLGWGCVSHDNQGPIVVCEDEKDLFGAKMAVG